ncbi:MAG: hypothetical protein WA414_05825 [Acidobacteriaceae bacterium]
MRYSIMLGALIAGIFLAGPAPKAQAQIAVQIGPEPVCPYGYFDYAPYACAPYGYYGPEWFNGGIFIGAGPWYHGGEHFYGHVDNRYDPHHGYHGRMPHRGEHAEAHPHGGFHGNEMRDGRGHVHGH